MFHYISENHPNPFRNFFMQLALGRTLLYFATGLFCVPWYSRTLNEIKRESTANTATVARRRRSGRNGPRGGPMNAAIHTLPQIQCYQAVTVPHV
jgi:lipopolysaccharide export LptBFGC system permease protein LptF